jgi:hypothetical protein
MNIQNNINIMLEKLKLWFLKNLFIIINYLVIFIAYSIIYGVDGVGFAEVLLGLWMFASVAYGGYCWFNKKFRI